jgi:hypothetical protein
VFDLTANMRADDILRAPRYESPLSDTSVVFNLYPANDQYEPVIHYFVIVVTSDVAARHRPDDFSIEDVISRIFHLFQLNSQGTAL